MLPPEVRVELGGQILYATRLAEIGMMPFLVRALLLGRMPWRASDALVIAGAGWFIVSMIVHLGLGAGIASGGALAMDVVLPFLFGRFFIRSATDFRRLLIMCAPGFMIAGIAMAIESISHRIIVRTAFENWFGAMPQYVGGAEAGTRQQVYDIRLGLLRSSGPFSFPILAGIFMASAGALYLRSGLRGWPRIGGLLAMPFAIFSVSSAAFLAIMLMMGGYIFDRLQRVIRGLRWDVALATTGWFVIGISLASNSGLTGLLGRLSLNPATAYFRKVAYQYGIESISAHPLFGIGFQSFERAFWMRSDSMDNYWLLLALRHGLFASVSLMAAAIFCVIACGLSSRRARSEADRNLLVMLAIVIASLIIVEITVALFGGIMAWHYLLLGAATSLSVKAMPKHQSFYRSTSK